jgi:uncharacterized membrane protein YkvA (DUF1232 family)
MYVWPSKKNKSKETERNKKLTALFKYVDYYSESELFQKMAGWGIKVGIEILYYALVLFYVLADEKVSMKNKLIIMGALGYFILPTDLVADFIPVFGFSDDAAFLSFALMSVSHAITPEIKEKAKNKLKELVSETFDPKALSLLLENNKAEKKES